MSETSSYEKEQLLREMADTVIEAFNALVNLVPSLPKGSADKAELMKQQYFTLKEKLSSEPVDLPSAMDAAMCLGINASKAADAAMNVEEDYPLPVDELNGLQSAGQRLTAYVHSQPTPTAPITVVDGRDLGRLLGKTAFNDGHVHASEAKAEELARQQSALEARFEALGRTADSAITRVESKVAEIGAGAQTQLEAEVQALKEKIKSSNEVFVRLLDDVKRYRDEAKTVAGDLAAHVLAGGYAANGERERQVADRLRIWSLVLMALVMIILGATLLQLSLAAMSWQQAGFRLAFSFALTLPIGYLAREASIHRSHSIELRKTALDMAALNPYLEALPEEQRYALKAEIATRIFFSDTKREVPQTYELNLQELLLKIIEAGRGGSNQST